MLGSIIMMSRGLDPIWNEYGLPFQAIFSLGWFLILGVAPVIAGVVAGAMTGGSWGKRVLAGALCAIPATRVYWYLSYGAGISDGFTLLAIGSYLAGFGALGGLISRRCSFMIVIIVTYLILLYALLPQIAD